MSKMVKIEKDVDGEKLSSEVVAESIPVWVENGWTVVDAADQGAPAIVDAPLPPAPVEEPSEHA